MRTIDADALKYKNLAEVNGRLTYVLTPEEINNAPTVPLPDFKEGYKQAIIDGKTNFTKAEGEWIDHSEDYGYAECPFCEHLTSCEGNIDELHYCWHCGAKLEKAVQND